LDKRRIVGALIDIAELSELVEDNSFRARSFRAAARALDAWGGDLGALVATGKVQGIAGIGKSIAEVIVDVWQSGSSPRLDELTALVPVGVRRLLDIPGLGPKKVRKLWKELGIESIDALAAACRDGKVEELEGFGKKSVEKILEGIAYVDSVGGRHLLPEAEAIAARIVAHLESAPGLEKIEVAGSLRRRSETVGDIDVLVASSQPAAVAERFLSLPGIETVNAEGPTKLSVRVEGGFAVDLRLVRGEEFPFALAYFTGSKEHNTALRGRAKKLGLRLNEYGLFPDDSDRSKSCADEAAIHRALGLDYMQPELRENLGEIELAEKGTLPVLLEESDVRGLIHVHTTYSDGLNTLEEMVEAARAKGYDYIGITDHSQSAFYANGLSPERVLEQHDEIDRLNRRLRGFRIFKGIESDIRADGSLDYDDEVLASFDFVIASLHSSLGQSEEEMTARVVRALENPFTSMLGHPTARLLLRREGVAIDMDRVLERAGQLGVVVEINANPRRLDLDWRFGPRARTLGLATSINPDAHSIDSIDDTRYGVWVARKAAWPVDLVVNTKSAAAFAKWMARRRRG
jgi:DNA polymerase (family 10)